MPYHRTLHETEILLDVHAPKPVAIVREVLDHLEAHGKLDAHERASVLAYLEREGDRLGAPADLGHGVAVLRLRGAATGSSHAALVRLAPGSEASDGAPIRFLWLVVGSGGPEEPDDDSLSTFGWMLADDRFTADALGAGSGDELVDVYERYLAFVESPPRAPADVPEELRRTGKPFGALIADIKRRMPHYGTDITDGLHPKVLASIFFLFFGCLAPTIAFGGLLSVLTGGEVGVVEAIVGTALCGTVYALFSAQPLTILGSTGPVVIFMGILYELCGSLGIPYLPSLAWVGLWTMVCLAIMAIAEVGALIRYFTRFTDEVFAALIAIIYIVEALRDALSGMVDPSVPRDSAMWALVLALGTFAIALQLSRFRRSPYLRRPFRELLADLGPTIAIVVMTGAAVWMRDVEVDTLAVPAQLAPSTARSWLVNPLEAPPWVWLASLGPALLVSTLLYLDQNITVRIVNSRDHRLRKGAGYHLDMLVMAALVGVCAMFGLPWNVAATVRSLNHVRSLADTESHGGHGGHDRIVRVRETRVSALAIHLAMGASLLFLGLLSKIPMAVLFGLFLFMGVASTRGNQFFERLRLWLMDPEMVPPTHYVRRVPRRVLHLFTTVQAVSLVLLWAVKASALGLMFPLFIALLVPVRLVLGRFVDDKYLAFLDAEELPGEEEERQID